MHDGGFPQECVFDTLMTEWWQLWPAVTLVMFQYVVSARRNNYSRVTDPSILDLLKKISIFCKGQFASALGWLSLEHKNR